MECVRYGEYRRSFYGALSSMGVKYFSVSSFLSLRENNPKRAEVLVQFLRAAGLYDRIWIRTLTNEHVCCSEPSVQWSAVMRLAAPTPP